MHQDMVATDGVLLDLLRKQSDMSIGQLASALQVTATAVRQRLTRLMGQGLVQRSVCRTGRGRPSHRYELTAAGRRRSGANFADLAVALWLEIREIKDPEVRRGLLQRISRRLAQVYATQVAGGDVGDKMDALAALFRERRIPFEVDRSRAELPVLNAMACPYPDLAERDRTVCAMERLLFTELLGQEVQLTRCRLDGESYCSFEPSLN